MIKINLDLKVDGCHNQNPFLLYHKLFIYTFMQLLMVKRVPHNLSNHEIVAKTFTQTVLVKMMAIKPICFKNKYVSDDTHRFKHLSMNLCAMRAGDFFLSLKILLPLELVENCKREKSTLQQNFKFSRGFELKTKCLSYFYYQDLRSNFH